MHLDQSTEQQLFQITKVHPQMPKSLEPASPNCEFKKGGGEREESFLNVYSCH